MPTLSGSTLNGAGAPVEGATVKVFRTADDSLVATGTSNASGLFAIPTPDIGPFYVVAYKDGSPFVGGMTNRNQVADVEAVITEAPAFKSNGTVGANTSTTSVNVPLATNAQGDILEVIAFCRGSTTPFTMPEGWAEKCPQFNVGGNQVGFFWKRSDGAEPIPALGNAGRTSTNLLAGQMLCYSGCKLEGTPFEGVYTEFSDSGVIVGPPVTGSGLKRLAVNLFVRGANTAAGPSLGWTENLDQGTGGGGACRFFADSAVLDYDGTIPGSNRGGTGQLYGAVGFALIGIGQDVVASPKVFTRGLWVWDAQSVVLPSATEQNILLNAALASGITDLYLYAPRAALQVIPEQYRVFIAKATAVGLRCWGLEGYRGWFSDDEGPQGLYDTMDAVVAYNASSAVDERFYGYHIDQEPADISGHPATFHNGIASSALSTTSGGVWQATQALDREMLMRDWVEIHAACRAILAAAGLKLGSAIPTWADDYFGEPVTATVGGVTANILVHLAANADELVVMNYNTTALNQIDRLKYEALTSSTALATAIETHAGIGSGISYADTAGKQSKAAALADLDTVRARFIGYPTFHGDAIHDWEGWRALAPASTDSSDPLAADPVSTDRVAQISFGVAGITNSAGWQTITATNGSIADVLDTTGAATGWGVSITNAFAGSAGSNGTTEGSQTGNNSGIFPDDVLRNFMFVQASADNAADVTITGLNPARAYDFLPVPSRKDVTGARLTAYTIQGQVIEVDAANNTANGALFADRIPDANGTVVLSVASGSNGATFGYLNGLRITEKLIQEVTAGTAAEPTADPLIAS